MKDVVIKVENLSKRYRLGLVGSTTLREDVGRWWAKARGKPDPTLPVDRQREAERKGKSLSHDSESSSANSYVWALRDVSFEVKRGEILGIIGRNGAGKSTLLKIMTRITAPTLGEVKVRGRVASLLEVGTGFHPELTGRENVFLNGAILGMTKAEISRKLDNIVAFAEVEKFIDTPVKRYSSGMYVRLAFAVAAHLDPEILLVDEVLAVGDIAFQKKCLGKMGDVARAGRTVLFVSHNMGAISNLCSRAILLNEGQIYAQGAANETIAAYMGLGREHEGERVWSDPATAPGDDRVRLRAVRIVSDGNVAADVDIGKDVHVQVDYWNLKPEACYSVSIHLLDSLGAPVLASGNSHTANLVRDEWFNNPYPAGLFRTTCVLPGYFLNEGRYSISALLLDPSGRILAEKRDAVSFTVYDTGGMRGDYTGLWIGIVRPRLAWKTEPLDNASDTHIRRQKQC